MPPSVAPAGGALTAAVTATTTDVVVVAATPTGLSRLNPIHAGLAGLARLVAPAGLD